MSKSKKVTAPAVVEETSAAPAAPENQSNASFIARKTMLASHRLAATSADMIAVNGGAKKASVFEFTAAVNAAIDTWGIDTTAIFATDRNPKAIKRFIQFVHAINAKDYLAIDKTSAIILYALKLTGGSPLTTDALHYLASGLKEGRISPETKGVNRTNVIKVMKGSVGRGTIETQLSRSVGKNGFLQIAGATKGEPGKVNQNVTLNESNPMVIAFFETMNAATEAQIEQVTGEGKGE